ncbi:MAG: hypothetical protein IPJ79_01165 [Bacteroidetes bacterium]|nr:hypothetical protein [Bacteroidota bacterium]
MESILALNPQLSTIIDEYTLEYVPTELGSSITLGRGINLTSLYDPKISIVSPFLEEEPILPKSTDLVSVNALRDISTLYIEDVSDERKAISLYANFKASFAFANFSAALFKTKSERTTSRSILFIMSNKQSGKYIQSDNINWETEPESESISDINERREDFFSKYGSHFIATIQYGFHIEILATCHSTEESELLSFQAAFKAWRLNGEFNGDFKTELKKSHTEILCKIRCGKVVGSGVVLTSFQEVDIFLDKLNSEEIKIYNGPISCIVKSYKATLLKYPKCRQIFSTDEVNSVVNGLPVGTIIAWHPTNLPLPAPELNILEFIPTGWLLCDGKNGTPDLSNRFIRGTSSHKYFKTSGGNEKHDHGKKTKGLPTDDGYDCSGSRARPPQTTGFNHVHGIEEDSHIPPYTNLYYLMKA